MNTKDIFLVGAGLVVGYILVGFLNKSKDKAEASSSINSDVKNENLFDCEKMWEEQSKYMKGPPEYLLKQKNGFLSSCKEGKIDYTKDFGNGLFVTYKNDCNKITNKCPIIRVVLNGVTYYTNNGKYYRQSAGGPTITVIPIEITEKQYIEEAISKIPF
jgi:hypothetical protein